MKIKLSRKSIVEIALYLMIALFVVIMAYRFSNLQFGYKRYETSTLNYEIANVLKVNIQDIKMDITDDFMNGYQNITVEFLSGNEKGKIVVIDNYLSATHNIVAKSGKKLIICCDTPDGVEPYYTVYNYYRSPYIWLILLVFLTIVALIGGKKGLRSSISLLFTIFMIVCFLLPGLYRGSSPIVITIISTCISTTVTIYLLNGLSYKTLVGIVSTMAGVISAGIIFIAISKLLIISGYQTEEAESLILIAQSTGLQINGVLFAGVTTASLGAVMDVGVSIGAALFEIIRLNPGITGKSLFLSGMNIGKDMIGTMTNTLILAFAGSSMMTLLIFISYGVSYHQLFSSDYLSVELAVAIAGSLAVVIMVPVTSALCALGYPRKKLEKR